MVVRRGVVVSIDKNVNQARSGVWEPTSIDKVNQPRRPDQVADQGADQGSGTWHKDGGSDRQGYVTL